MLIEVKARVKRRINDKTRSKIETYLVDKEFFAQAEGAILQELSEEQSSNLLEEFEIMSLKIASVKEIASQYQGENPFVVTLQDTWVEDDGTEKHLKYKVLLWAQDLTEANDRAHELSREGYNMLIEGIKQVDYIYLTEE